MHYRVSRVSCEMLIVNSKHTEIDEDLSALLNAGWLVDIPYCWRETVPWTVAGVQARRTTAPLGVVQTLSPVRTSRVDGLAISRSPVRLRPASVTLGKSLKLAVVKVRGRAGEGLAHPLV